MKPSHVEKNTFQQECFFLKCFGLAHVASVILPLDIDRLSFRLRACVTPGCHGGSAQAVHEKH